MEKMKARNRKAKGRDPFVALTECHLLNQNTVAEISYYPGFQRWMQSMEPVLRTWALRNPEDEWPAPRAAELVRYMDAAGVDVAFVLREPAMNVSGYTTSMSTNGFILQEIEPYPDRLYLECNVGPILRRGVKHAIWELEYLVKERNAKLCKVYQPEDDGPLNDRRMWPFYEKACELDIPLTIHTGTAYVLPHPDQSTRPIMLDDILLDFPDLQIIAYHMGWPYTEELIGLAGKHRNLYLSLSGIGGWCARAPNRGYHMIGEALQWAGPDRIVMGLDLPFDETRRIVDYVRNLEMPEELQEKWGYAPITDGMRAKILGLNLAALTKLPTEKRV